MMSLMQAEAFYGDTVDGQIDKIDDLQQSKDDDGLGYLANSGAVSPGNVAGGDGAADEDQFQFVANLNQQYEDAM